jgi:hypothetical protein
MKQLKFSLATITVLFIVGTFNIVAQSAPYFANLSVNAQLQNERRVRISWVTPIGYEASSFIIQKSNNASDFEDIGKAEARLDKQKKLLYVMYDDDIVLNDKKYYYRVVEFKDGGGSKISDAVEMVILEEMKKNVVTTNTSSKILIEKVGGIDQIKIKGATAAEFKLAQVTIAKEQSDLGFVCCLEVGGEDEMILKPMYQLESGDYVIKVKDANGTKKYKFSIRDADVALN